MFTHTSFVITGNYLVLKIPLFTTEEVTSYIIVLLPRDTQKTANIMKLKLP